MAHLAIYSAVGVGPRHELRIPIVRLLAVIAWIYARSQPERRAQKATVALMQRQLIGKDQSQVGRSFEDAGYDGAPAGNHSVL